jgi:hypothetical protein
MRESITIKRLARRLCASLTRHRNVRGVLRAQKVYPTDQHIREFLGQWIHSLAAAAGNPFLTTGARSRFPLQFVRSPSLLTGSYSGPDLIRSVAVEMQVAEHI